MNFTEIIINALVIEEANYGKGAGLTRREIERLGTAFKITRHEARDTFSNLQKNGFIRAAKKTIGGKREKVWTLNKKKLDRVGQ